MTNPTKQFIGEEEWENFQPTEVLSSDVSGKLWNNINNNTNSPAAHSSYFRWIAVAASVLLVVGLSWQFILKKPATSIIPAATAAITKHISNTTPEKKELMLSDGSRVELLPSSKISYPENFSPVKREVILNGEATFDVARDVAKPFSVYCNSVLITVLGTRFTVNSYEANTVTKVILHDGRVMVKISDSSSRDNKNEYYLTPGDVFIYKKGSNRFDSLFTRVLHLEKDKDDRYLFDNSPLDVVFDQLQIIYNTKIGYNRAELGNRTFIGKIDKNEPVDHILKSIALLNKFRLQKQADGFMISN